MEETKMSRYSISMNTKLNDNSIFSIVPYYGGKALLADDLLEYIQLTAEANGAHTYVECFGGGGRCLLNLCKIPYSFRQMYYNEWDETMCCLFKAISVESLADKLYWKLMDTSFDKETFLASAAASKLDDTGKTVDRSLTIVEKAFHAFITCHLSFNSSRKDFAEGKVDNATNAIDRVLEVYDDLQGLKVRQGDYRKILEVFGADPKVVKYLDPPYHPCTRERGSTDVYRKETSAQGHRELVELLCHSRSWVLSGYDPAQYGCDDYKPLEECGAKKINLKNVHLASSNRATKSAPLNKDEFIWYKL